MAESYPKRIENTVGKGEIARHEQFLLFPLCFQKTCTADTGKPGLVWERVNTHIRLLTTVTKEAFEKILGKRENARNQHFLLFLQNVFYPVKNKFEFLSHIYSVVCKSFKSGPV